MTDNPPPITIRNPLDATLGYEIRRLAVAVANAHTAALEPLGLRANEASLLTIIAANPGCTQAEVCRALGIQPANMVALVNRLVAEGWVARAAQGRAQLLQLTQAGAAMHQQVDAAFAALEQRLSRGLATDQRQQLIPLLAALCKNACCPCGEEN